MRTIKNVGISVLLVEFFLVAPVLAMDVEDDPLLFMFKLDRFEKQHTDGHDPLAWEVDAWLGRDLNKLWIKSEGDYVDDTTEESELQLLYSRAITPFWDLQAGWRGEFQPDPERHWFALGAHGLAPYWFEIDAALFAGESGRLGARLTADYDHFLSPHWVLSQELELNFHSKDDAERGIGSGLSELELGLRLRYHISREFAPYVGVNWQRKIGQTADLARDEDEEVDDAQFVTGFRLWF